jgi:hypothetical protein
MPSAVRVTCSAPAHQVMRINICCMYDMTLSPREAIAKFQDLFNEHYYRCVLTSLSYVRSR